MKTCYRFDDREYNPASGELTSPSGVVVLQPQPARLLETLLASAGEVVSREELYDALWPKTKVEFDLGLNAAVRSLRIVLGDDANAPRYVETLRRRGYRWIAPVREVEVGGRLMTLRRSPGRRRSLVTLGLVASVLFLTWLRGATPDSRPDPHIEPELVQLRYLLEHGDDDDVQRAATELGRLRPEVRESDQGLALSAELRYQMGKFDEAEEAARAALALNEWQVHARRILGLIHLYRDLDPQRAATVLEAAVEQEPESSELLHAFGLTLAAQGRFREAMETMRRAVALDPVSPNLTFDGWLVAYLARDFGTSRHWCGDMERLTGSDVSRCHFLAALAAGQRVEAANIARQVLGEQDFHVAGLDDSPESLLEAYWSWDLSRSREHLPLAQQAFGEARALAQLGRLSEAMDRLDLAASGKAPEMVFARYLPYFDPLSDDSRFKEVVAAGRLQLELQE